MKWAYRFSEAHPVLELGGGSGRNSVALAQRRHNVVCADRDIKRLGELADFISRKSIAKSVLPVCVDLRRDYWPFADNSVSAIVCVHFLDLALLPQIRFSLRQGGHLFIETVGGHGENYRELPRAGELHRLLSPNFRFELYDERLAGPAQRGRRTVKLFASRVS